VTVGVRYDTASVLVAGIAIALASGAHVAAVGMAVSGVVPVIVYALVAWSHGWPLVPVSVLLKRRLAGVDPRTWHGLLDMLGGGLVTLVGSPPLLVLVLAALALLWWSVRGGAQPDESRHRESQLLLGVFIVATLVHVQFGRLGWLYRYEAYLVALGVVATASALGHVGLSRARLRGPTEAAVGILVVAMLTQPLLLRGGRAWRDVVASAGTEYRNQYRLGLFLQRHPQGPVVLVSLTPAYLIDEPIVDLGGIGTLDVWTAMSRGALTAEVTNQIALDRHARVMVAGAFPVAGAWVCAAAWRDREPDGDDQFFYAADTASAATLTRDLRAFEAEDVPRGVDLTLVSAMPGGRCPSH
jgi:hypothetical protein